METKVITINKDFFNPQELSEAAKVIRCGGLVAFPTETVYGLGANALEKDAVSKIYHAKGRPSDNPLILHIANASDVLPLAAAVPASARLLMKAFWPGPLTLVMKKAKVVPETVTGGLNTVAIRLPDSAVARAFIDLAGLPIAAPSANLSGRPSPTNAQTVWEDLHGKIETIVDAGPCQIGLESTVVDCTSSIPTVLRPGGITMEMLRSVLGEVDMYHATPTSYKGVVPRSPGMKYTHYAPAAPMTLLEGDADIVVPRLQEEIREALANGKRVGAIVSAETAVQLPEKTEVVVYGRRNDPEEVAHRIFEALRYFDYNSVDIIYGEGLHEEGLGLAVMNRLRKAANQQILCSQFEQEKR